jgi:tRNA threonylcarbamoyladenosine biosynthesis protein TsaB
MHDIEGVVCFKGPGSFTGLRIGLTVGNALAYAQNIPVVASKSKLAGKRN